MNIFNFILYFVIIKKFYLNIRKNLNHLLIIKTHLIKFLIVYYIG